MLYNVLKNRQFIKYQKEMAAKLNQIIFEHTNEKEVDLIKKIIDSVKHSSTSKPSFISVTSKFIHGTKSLVKFETPIKTKQKSTEVGDILFSISIFDKDNLLAHKISFTQVKKDLLLKWKPRGNEKNQLYFLSTFPIFKGYHGIFPKKDVILKDTSKTLGTYLFLNKIHGIEFISAYVLANFINKERFSNCLCNIFFRNRLNYFCLKYRCNPIMPYYAHPCYINSDCLYCPETFNFIENLTEFRIGELIQNSLEAYQDININKTARFFFAALLKYLEQSNEKEDNILHKYIKHYEDEVHKIEIEKETKNTKIVKGIVDIEINLNKIHN